MIKRKLFNVLALDRQAHLISVSIKINHIPH